MGVIVYICGVDAVWSGAGIEIGTCALFAALQCPAAGSNKKDVIDQGFVKHFASGTSAHGTGRHTLQFVGRPWLEPRLIERNG